MSTLMNRSTWLGTGMLAVGMIGVSTSGIAIAAENALEEIVVTAQKREQSLQKTPIAITAFSEEMIESAGIQQIEGLEQSVPSINFGRGDRGRGDITIRGVSDFARMPGLDARAGLYVDGVLLGRSQTGVQGLSNVERVEVLRGPQGTLFGRNTVSGAINVITKVPTADFSAEGRVGSGNYNHIEAGAFVNVPITDSLFTNFEYQKSERDGYIDNVAGGPDLESSDTQQFRAQLLFVPIDELTIRVSADYYEDKGFLASGESLNFDEIPYKTHADLAPDVSTNPRAAANGGDWPQVDVELKGIATHVDYRLGEGYILQSVSAYREMAFAILQDDDMGESVARAGIPAIWGSKDQSNKFFTQEFRIVSPRWDRFDFVAGVFYLDEVNTANDTGNVEAPGFAGAIGFANTDAEVDVKSLAAYANANYRISDQLEMVAGVRWTEDEKSLYFAQPSTLPFFANVPASQAIRDSRTDRDFSPKLGINWFPAPRLMLYGSWSQGFKSGAFHTDFVAPFNSADELTVDPETVESYELGLKSTLLDTVQINLAAYRAEYENYQDFAAQPGRNPGDLTTFLLRNAAKATSQGVEVELDWLATDHITLHAAYAYNDATFDSYPNATRQGDDFSGNRLKFAPENKAYLAADFEYPVSNDWTFFSRVDYSWTDEFFALNSNAAISAVDDYWSINARAGLENGGWQGFIWASNLTDEANIRSADNSVGPITRVTYDPPRMYGVTLKYKFK